MSDDPLPRRKHRTLPEHERHARAVALHERTVRRAQAKDLACKAKDASGLSYAAIAEMTGCSKRMTELMFSRQDRYSNIRYAELIALAERTHGKIIAALLIEHVQRRLEGKT